MIDLGVDAYCWHARLAAGEVSLLEVLDETAELEVAYLQTELDYARNCSGGLDGVVARANANDLRLEANGGAIGRPYFDADSKRAASAVSDWLREAQQLGCSSLVVHSGVYRPELDSRPGSAEEELRFLREVVDGAVGVAADLELQLLVENASDFRSSELVRLLQGSERSLALFLDVTNPYNVFEDPIDAVARMAPIARMGHVKDFVLSSNWTPDRAHRRGYSVEFRYPCEGTTDLRGTLAQLAKATAGREFPLAIEGLDSKAGVDDQVPRLKASLTKLRAILAEVVVEGEAPTR